MSVRALGHISLVTAVMATVATVDAGTATASTLRASPPPWVIMMSQDPPGHRGTQLQAVSCSAADSCMAAGYFEGSFFQPVTEKWDGANWTVTPSPALPNDAFFNGVSCVSATDCFAVGSSLGYKALPLIEHWDGSAWSEIAGPALGTFEGAALGGDLRAVSCVASTDCTAVGLTYGVALTETLDGSTLVEHWDGTAWTVVTSPNTTGATPYSSLNSVVCASSGCVAVGESTDAKGITFNPLVERWDGVAWSIAPSPKPAGARISILQSVSCGGPQSCMAAGYTLTGPAGSRETTLIERWDGISWTVAASPNPPGGAYNILSAVSCVTATYCIAAGDSVTASPGPDTTVVEQWDGSAWTIVPSPNPAGASFSRFFGLACISLTTCTAVGISGGSGGYTAFIERSVTAPSFTYPLNGQSNIDSTRRITWSPSPQAQAYIVVIGSTTFGTDLANSGILSPTTSSFNLPDLPVGHVLFATLLTEFDGEWLSYQDIWFIATA